MNYRHHLPFIALVLLLIHPLHAMKDTCPADILLETDQAFSNRAQEIGIPAAFLEYAAEDAVVYRTGMEPIVGKDAIRKVMEADPEGILVWKPLVADIAESGDLGYTRGKSVYSTKPTADGKPGMGPFEGYYVSIWKKQADGSWKWVFDSGIISKFPPQSLQEETNR